jgi:hypothetical protein
MLEEFLMSALEEEDLMTCCSNTMGHFHISTRWWHAVQTKWGISVFPQGSDGLLKSHFYIGLNWQKQAYHFPTPLAWPFSLQLFLLGIHQGCCVCATHDCHFVQTYWEELQWPQLPLASLTVCGLKLNMHMISARPLMVRVHWTSVKFRSQILDHVI